MSNPCVTINKAVEDKYKKEHALEDEIIQLWKNDRILKLVGADNPEMFKRLYQNVTGESFEYGGIPALKDLKKLKIKTNQMINGVVKTPGKFAEWFFLPDVIASKNPIAKQAVDRFVIQSNYYRGHREMFDSKINDMNKSLMNSMGINSLMDRMSYKKAIKELNKRQQTYQDLMTKGEKGEATLYRQKFLDNIVKNSEIDILVKADRLLRDPEILKDPQKVKDYDPGLINAAKIWHGSKKEVGLKDQLLNTLENGLDAYISVLERAAGSYSKGQSSNDFINIHNRIKELKDILVKEKNYVPTEMLDIFPQLERVSQIMHNKSRKRGEVESLDMQVKDMIESVIKNIDVSKHIMPKTYDEMTINRSKNLIGTLDAYAKNVIRFNYAANTSNNLVKHLQQFAKLNSKAPEQLGHVARFYTNFLTDMHGNMMGYNKKNPVLQGFARSITAFEFISKLGLNPRSWARNATQSVQNINYFGWSGVRETIELANRHDLRTIIDDEMKKHGIFFINTTNIAELASPKGSQSRIKEDPNNPGKYVEDYGSFADRFNKGLEKIAQTTSKPMSWVENKVNRTLTFKMAFTQRFNHLSGDKSIVKKMNERYRNDKDVDIAAKVREEVIRRSSRFAANATKEIHFDYSPFMKAKIFQNPVGSVIGQYTTFGINSLNYKYKIFRDGLLDYRVGKFTKRQGAHDAARMHRLFMTHMFITGLLGPLMNMDLTILYQDDTLERVGNLVKWWEADEKEREKLNKDAFFGKGPLLGNMGPFVSDIWTLGQVSNVIKMDEDNWATWLQGYKDYSPDTKQERKDKILQVFNSGVWKILREDGYLEQNRNGISAGTLIMNELGFRGTRENQKKQDYIEDIVGSEWFKDGNLSKNVQIDFEDIRPGGGKPKFTKGKPKLSRGKNRRTTGNKMPSTDYDYDAALKILETLAP